MSVNIRIAPTASQPVSGRGAFSPDRKPRAKRPFLRVTTSTVIRLTSALNAWGTPDFEDILKAEVKQLGASQLPLQQGLTTGSYAVDSKLDVMIIRMSEGEKVIRAKAGIFYTGIIAGCSCADDPTPVDEQSEYCEVLIDIDRITGEARITPAGD